MRFSLPKLIIFSLACLVSAAALADTDNPLSAQQLINNMSRALSTLNYDGIFIYQRGQQMDTMRLIHKADSNGEFERLISLTGYPREVIRNNESVTCIFPDNQSVMVEKSRPGKLVSPLPDSIETVASNYTFAVTGEDRVTGRQAWVIGIIPNDQYRYGYQLWIDKENNLLLKSELRNKAGTPLEQIMFTQLEVLDAIPDSLLEPSLSGTNYTWYENTPETVSKRSGESQWGVTWMPAGFSMRDYEKQITGDDAAPVEHLIYTDGIAMVSIFIEKLKRDMVISVGPSRLGGVNTFARFFGGYQVTAVGEVPQATVQGMANSVFTQR